jgi:hypothetical protein
LIFRRENAANLDKSDAGGIKDIPPVSEIMRRLVAETEAALRKVADLSVAI